MRSQVPQKQGVTGLHELPCSGVTSIMHEEFVLHGNESLHPQVGQPYAIEARVNGAAFHSGCADNAA
jgi:hypothetical protein